MSDDWSEKSAEMMRSWMDAQRTLWEAWAEMAWGSSKKPPGFSEVSDEWQKMVQQSLGAWSEAADPILHTTAERVIAAQGVMLRFIEFAAKAWEKSAPKLQSGQDWQAAMRESIEQMRQYWLGLPQQATDMAQDTEALWQMYMDQWRAFGQPWGSAWSKAPGLYGRAVSGDSAALFELSNVFHQAYQQTMGRFMNSPNLGMARESTARMQKGFDDFAALNLAQAEYQAVLSEIWDKALKQFAEDLASMAEKGETITNVRDLITLWTRGAEEIFLEAFRGERYTLAQGKLLNASMQFRISQRRIMEDYLEMFDLPTRSELDEAHRRIYELKREVKALKKQVATLSAKPKTPTTASKPRNRPAKSPEGETVKGSTKAAGATKKGG